ncbi:methylmalonyl-CoA mutase family protein [Alphaproteobacteria bacterium]|nr:methylmalonyl-CoA mutase family protein [Alphaproteobacteria bacterium]
MSSDESVFPASSHASWAAAVSRLLKGAPASSLDRLDEDGLPTAVFYPVTAKNDAVQNSNIRTYPQNPSHWLRHGWDICQPIEVKGIDPAAILRTNTSMLAALETGANSIWLTSGGDIAPVMTSLFEGIVLPAISVTIDAGADTDLVLPALLSGQGAPYRINLAHSPLSDAGIKAGLAYATSPAVSGIFVVDGWALHNQGLTSVAELGCLLGGVAAILRAGQNLTPLDELVPKISLTIALPADMFTGIAKVRAMRQLLSSLFNALDIKPDAPRLIGRPSLRMASRLDQDENMLRNTTAMLGGAIGGVDVMAALGHDYLSGESEAGRRLARTTQLMMIEESGLAHSLDPAGGSPFIEARTDDLARAGWQMFQRIEAAGGLPKFANAGGISDLANRANKKREAQLRAGQTKLVGVNLQPSPHPVAPLIHSGISSGPDVLIRPAAVIEALREQAATSPCRILMVQSGDPTKGQRGSENAVKKLLAIAGLQPVVITMKEPGEQMQEIAAAKPDVVINCSEAALSNLPENSTYYVAGDLLAAKDQIGMLQQMITQAAA